MARLTGEFHSDLPEQRALEACAEAVHGLGWEVESVQPGRIVAHPSGSGSSPTIEFELAGSSEGTDIRIVGSDSEKEPLEHDALVAELDRARDAMTSAFESAEAEPAEVEQPVAEADQPGATSVARSSSPREAESKPEATPSQEPRTPPGWYPDAYDSGRLQYWDGDRWTQDHRPADVRETPSSPTAADTPASKESNITKDLIWALSLACGCVAGIAGGFGVPVINYYIPFGFGAAGIALAIAAFTQPGRTPWWAWLAVSGSVTGLIAGISGYTDFQDLQDELNSAQQSLDDLGSP